MREVADEIRSRHVVRMMDRFARVEQESLDVPAQRGEARPAVVEDRFPCGHQPHEEQRREPGIVLGPDGRVLKAQGVRLGQLLPARPVGLQFRVVPGGGRADLVSARLGGIPRRE